MGRMKEAQSGKWKGGCREGLREGKGRNGDERGTCLGLFLVTHSLL
jgi:hypothetical protein